MSKELNKAIVNVMKAVAGIEKNLTVGAGNNSYKGVADQDVKKIIGNAMAENGLCILPIEIAPTIRIDRWEQIYNGQAQQKQQIFTEVTTKYMLIHESGESMEIVGYGHGIDTQDKSAGKATTYALKYVLLYTFLVPTGKIDDADNVHSESYQTPPKKQVQKSTMVLDSDIFRAALKYMKEGGNIAEIEKKYTLSQEIKTKLTTND